MLDTGVLLSASLRSFLLRRLPILHVPVVHRTHVFRKDDVEEVLREQEVFRVTEFDARMAATAGRFFLGMDDGEEYRREQEAAATALRRIPVDDVGTVARKTAHEAVQRARSAAEGDVARIDALVDVADRIPVAVVHKLLGVPEPSGLKPGAPSRLLQWVKIVSIYIFTARVAPPLHGHIRRRAIHAGRALARHLRKVVEEREASGPASHQVLDALIAELDDADAAARTIGGLLAGALGPTVSLAKPLLRRLLALQREDPEIYADLRSAAQAGNRERVREHVLEAARFSPRPPHIHRRCHRPYVLARGSERETLVPTGQTVLAWVESAARDPWAVRSPERFEPGRPEPEYLLFGHGLHECLGRSWGETMHVELVTALFALPNLRTVANPTWKWHPGKTLGTRLVLQVAYGSTLQLEFDLS